MADETPPLDDAQLAEIRAGLVETQAAMRNWYAEHPRPGDDNPFEHIVADTYAFRTVPILLGEVDRLRASRDEAMTMLAEGVEHVRTLMAEIAAIVTAQDAVTSAEARWHQVTRTDSYPESVVSQADRTRVTALRIRDTAIEQARAFLASAEQAAEMRAKIKE